MSSFQEIQALAVARSKASQAKLAAERAEKQRAEADRKSAEDAAARKRAQHERQALVAREQRRREEAEATRRREEQERKAKEAREQRRHEQEVARLQLHKSGNGTETQSRKGVGKGATNMKEFAAAGRKAIARAGGSNRAKTEPSSFAENEDGFLSSARGSGAGDYSTLTREEKRARRERAILGTSGSSRRKPRAQGRGLSTTQRGSHLPGSDNHAELVALGQSRRDKRTIDEIEQELRASKIAARAVGNNKAETAAAAREERELEAMLRRKRAMAAKKTATPGGVDSGNEAASPVPSKNVPTPAKQTNSSSSPAARCVLQPPARETATSRTTNAFGLTAADYLPGAPIRHDVRGHEKPQPENKKVSSVKKETAKAKASSSSTSPPPSKTANKPPRRETPRDRFLREEAERKARQRQSAAGQRFDEDGEEGEGDTDEDEDDYSSEEDAEDGADYRDEIWKIFGRDRRKYTSRQDDSDDDMEADMDSVAREEARSTRFARLEDEREERELARQKAEKAARKRARLA